jgi:ubiquitin-protein ligase E3 C
VLSDDDLHVRAAPFSTAATRAIATSLNALVYHTHFPKRQQQQRQHSIAHRDSGSCSAEPPLATLRGGSALLERYAPQALRGLYERDQRRPFCQAALWTAPYDGDAAQQQATGLSGSGAGGVGTEGGTQPVPQHSGLRAVAAVVQGLLFGGSGASSTAAPDGNSSGGAPAAALAAVVSGAPSAMTALLRAAPQCVPFEVRLQLFR